MGLTVDGTTSVGATPMPAAVDLLPGIAPGTGHRRSVLHAEACVWVEKNCYVDVWIEAIHALGLEPRAMLPFTLALDFLGDQWTFFKPPHESLRTLYGLDVQELNVWRPLLAHALEHLAGGRLLSTEADAWWLPDTAGTDYRRTHTKTTIILAALDVDAQRARYFHNAGYYELAGEDFRGLFGLETDPQAVRLPLYAELIALDRRVAHPPERLQALSAAMLREQLRWRPADNPVARFATRFEAEQPGLQSRGLAHFHAWAFATLRQLGAAFELAAAHLRWLETGSAAERQRAAACFDTIAASSQSLILKCARAVNSGRPLDAHASLAPIAQAWDDGMDAVGRVAG